MREYGLSNGKQRIGRKMKKNNKTIYCCQECGYQSPKWLGRCPECNGWDSFAEEKKLPANRYSVKQERTTYHTEAIPIDSVEIPVENRVSTGIHEFDRVLGGGIISGSLVLIGGDPGIGKSTLLLQVFQELANQAARFFMCPARNPSGS